MPDDDNEKIEYCLRRHCSCLENGLETGGNSNAACAIFLIGVPRETKTNCTLVVLDSELLNLSLPDLKNEIVEQMGFRLMLETKTFVTGCALNAVHCVRLEV